MEEELRYAPLSFRNPMMSKLRNYRKDLAKLHREVRSTPLTATPGGRGDMKYGTYTVENEHMVSFSCFFPLWACIQELTILWSTVHVTVYTALHSFPHRPLSCIQFSFSWVFTLLYLMQIFPNHMLIYFSLYPLYVKQCLVCSGGMRYLILLYLNSVFWPIDLVSFSHMPKKFS